MAWQGNAVHITDPLWEQSSLTMVELPTTETLWRSYDVIVTLEVNYVWLCFKILCVSLGRVFRNRSWIQEMMKPQEGLFTGFKMADCNRVCPSARELHITFNVKQVVVKPQYNKMQATCIITGTSRKRHGISNYWKCVSLFNRLLFMMTSYKDIKAEATGPLWRKPTDDLYGSRLCSLIAEKYNGVTKSPTFSICTYMQLTRESIMIT